MVVAGGEGFGVSIKRWCASLLHTRTLFASRCLFSRTPDSEISSVVGRLSPAVLWCILFCFCGLACSMVVRVALGRLFGFASWLEACCGGIYLDFYLSLGFGEIQDQQ
ncbi:hypothetical protein AALP_AA4G069600 [Arabis alpina]|uniref:Uncharacterized protein n=1 Tax=Arabis alpina TaxID=50452 RepID=A0A087H1N4_ARAAL|nr:hypothetical protein AALP_AA4G069600 [Arabis alpina]